MNAGMGFKESFKLELLLLTRDFGIVLSTPFAYFTHTLWPHHLKMQQPYCVVVDLVVPELL